MKYENPRNYVIMRVRDSRGDPRDRPLREQYIQKDEHKIRPYAAARVSGAGNALGRLSEPEPFRCSRKGLIFLDILLKMPPQ